MSKQKHMTTAEYRAMLMGKQSENEFEKMILEYASLKGWRIIHHRPAMTKDGWRTPMSGDPGFPDLVIAKGGTVIFAELKSATGTLSPDQKAWIEAINGHEHTQSLNESNLNGFDVGIDYHVAFEWRPHHWEQIERLLG